MKKHEKAKSRSAHLRYECAQNLLGGFLVMFSRFGSVFWVVQSVILEPEKRRSAFAGQICWLVLEIFIDYLKSPGSSRLLVQETVLFAPQENPIVSIDFLYVNCLDKLVD